MTNNTGTKKSLIGDRVFADSNQTGIQDIGEQGIFNVVVNLLDANGNILETTTTNQNGKYLFEDLTPGEYKVSFVKPSEFSGFSPQNVGDNEKFDSDANPNTGVTDVINLKFKEQNRTFDAGLIKKNKPHPKKAEIGDRVFNDLDGDGIQDAGEPGVPNAKVDLLDDNDNVVGTKFTDQNGIYSFRVDPGTYRIEVTPPGGFDGFSPQDVGNNDRIDSDVNPNNGRTDLVTLNPGEINNSVDAGLTKNQPPATGSIGDFVFDDVDCDGKQDGNEPGVENVTVRLLTPKGDVIRETVTDENGFYLFDNLEAGNYRVAVVKPNGFDGFTIQNAQGVSDAEDSDVNPNTGVSQIIHLDPGENNRTVDAGLKKDPPPETSALGDFVFEDLDGDGFQYPNEPGVGDVTIRLQTPDGQTVETTTTDNDGGYLFDGLEPGRYKITVEQPDGFEFTEQFATFNGSRLNALDSNINPANGMSNVVNLRPGQTNRTIDAGLVEDAPPERASLGDRVFFDENRNGIQDDGEDGVENVVVRLQTPEGQTLETTATNSDGNYLFDDLEPGSYKVTFVQPSNFDGFTTPNVGDDTLDSDADPSNGMSQVVTLDAGEDDLTVDAGLVVDAPPERAALGDFVFNDLDEDGIQDDNEPGIEGATVILQTPGGDTLEETLTNDNGIYSFDDLEPGSYKVTFVQPDGFNSVSPFFAGGDRAEDSDANPNNGLMSRVVTLAPGEVNNTIDAGFFDDTPDVTPGIDIEKFVRVEPVGLPPGQFGQDVCDEFGKPQALIFQYTGGEAITQTAQDGDKATATGAAIFDEVVTVSASGKKGKGGSFFSQEVELGERVTISASSFGKGKFDSESNFTLSGDSPGETQSLTYHTSCSQPIRLGDVLGGLTLVGFQGEDGSTSLPVSNPTDDLDADDAPGPDAQVGDDIVFTYVVNNTGDTALGDINVTDDRLDPDFVEGDDNNNGLLDTDEEWTYTASETATEGLQTNIGTVVGTPVNDNGDDLGLDDVTDSDAANYTGSTPPEPPPISGDLCEVLGKPTSLTFLYEPSNTVNTAQEKFEFSGTADDDDIAFVVGGGKGGKSKGGVTGTGGQQVSTGETFTVNVDGSNTEITIFDDANGPALQFIEYHTSCSDIIQLGDQIGSITLVGYNGEDGSTSLSQEQIDDLVG